MTHTSPEAGTAPIRLLRGTITNYRKTRSTSDFMFTQSDRDRMGITAVAVSLAGLGGIAVGLAASAMDTSEEADLLEFDLNDKHVRAWVWLSLFKDGDQVEVVAEPMGDVWQGYGVRRISDKIVALHPHCSRGRAAHWMAALKSWAKWSSWLILTPLIAFMIYIVIKSDHIDLFGTFVVLPMVGIMAFIIYGIIAYRIASKLMIFVDLAEDIFTAFNWEDVKKIDLPAITKRTKRLGEAGALGVLYFRY